MDACTWDQKSLNTASRWYRYLREYREGIRLRLLCRSCNARENQHVHGTHQERAARNVTSIKTGKAQQIQAA